MKKIIGGVLAVGALVLPSVSFAAAFNSDPQDFATLRVVNYTTSSTCATCWGSTATVNTGEVVSFAIYYHNVGPDVATNVRVRFTPQSTMLGTSHIFTATVTADNAPAVSGTVTVTTTASQTLSFLQNAVIWRPNQATAGSTALPGAQLSTDIFNGVGINLGSIAPGWTTQGSVVVRFQASSVGGAGATVLAPTVTTSNATAISQTTATLNGSVTPNGANTNAWFEWGTTPSYGSFTPSYSYGIAATNYSHGLVGLTPNTTYYFRAVAQNLQGTSYGAPMIFVTSGTGNTGTALPVITTQPATSIAGDFAILNGYVDPVNTNDAVRWFEWGTNANPGSQNQTTHYNQGATAGAFSASLSGLTQNVTYYYRAVAQNSYGIVYGSVYSFTTGVSNTGGNTCGAWGWGGNCGANVVMVSTRNADTSGDFAILNGYVDPVNTNDTVRWFEWSGSQALGNSTQMLSQGNVASNFSASLTGLVPNTTYYYRAVARNSQGTVRGNILSFTTGGQVAASNTVGSLPVSTTLLATELTGATGKLNGLVFTSANQPSNAWFEWGMNSSLGNKTQTVSVGALPSVRHSDVLTGLVQGQTYYYRIVAENPYGKVYGLINSFVSEGNSGATQTTNTTVTTTPVYTNRSVSVVNRVVPASSAISLSIDGGAEVITGGEKRSYHVVWKNDSTQHLKNVILHVTFSQKMNFGSATMGEFSASSNAVVVEVKTLAPGETGGMFIVATADRSVKTGDLIVVTANMVYTNTDGTQSDALAYMTHRGETSSGVLGASIFGAGSFLPTTLFGWMILIILILILVLLGNHVYGRFSDPSTSAH